MSKNEKNQGLQPDYEPIIEDPEEDCQYPEQYWIEHEKYCQEQSDTALLIHLGISF